MIRARFTASLATLATIACCADALAQQRRPTPAPAAQPAWYVGVGAGVAQIKNPDSDFLRVGGATESGASMDTTHPTLRVLGGLKVNRYFGIEAGYGSYGTFGGQRTFSAPAGTLGAKVHVTGFNFHAVGWLPLTDSFAGFAKVGYVATTVKTEASTTLAGLTAPNLSRREINLAYGLGFQYDYSARWAFRAEWEQIKNVGNKNDYGLETNVSVTSASALMKF